MPPPTDYVTTLEEVRERDSKVAETWFTGPRSFTSLAARDRRWLLARIEELTKDLAARQEAEKPQPLPQIKDGLDILVNFGDLSTAKMSQVKLDAGYEQMIEDILGNVNHIISCGIRPIVALCAMCQSTAIAMSNGVRQGLALKDAERLIRMQLAAAQAATIRAVPSANQ